MDRYHDLVEENEIKEPDEEWNDLAHSSGSVIDGPPPPLQFDINFEERPGGFEIWYSDRIANHHQDLVDQSAEYLENCLGLVNLGQIDFKVLIADGPLTSEIKKGLIAWWTARVDDLELG